MGVEILARRIITPNAESGHQALVSRYREAICITASLGASFIRMEVEMELEFHQQVELNRHT